jgi:hypothetical protein
MTGDWKMEDVLKEEMEKIRLQVCHVVWACLVTMVLCLSCRCCAALKECCLEVVRERMQ